MIFLVYRIVKLIGGGSVIHGPTPFFFLKIFTQVEPFPGFWTVGSVDLLSDDDNNDDFDKKYDNNNRNNIRCHQCQRKPQPHNI